VEIVKKKNLRGSQPLGLFNSPLLARAEENCGSRLVIEQAKVPKAAQSLQGSLKVLKCKTLILCYKTCLLKLNTEHKHVLLTMFLGKIS